MPDNSGNYIRHTQDNYREMINAVEKLVQEITGENHQARPTTHETKLKVTDLKPEDPFLVADQHYKTRWRHKIFNFKKGRK